MGVFSRFLNLIFPKKCVFCGKFLKNDEASICSACLSELPFTVGSGARRSGEFFDVCVFPFYYKGNVRKSILRFKFRGATHYTDCYSKIIADCINQNLSGVYDLISWVPLSSKRERTRGYDQAMLLALAVALELDDVAVETLRKKEDIAAQSSLGGKDARRANISGAYEAVDPELIANKRILLIDDIITTGSTLSECAKTLLMAGAESVVCTALASSE